MRKEKFCYLYHFIFMFLLLTRLESVQIDQQKHQDDKAFYAISSLCFYLDELNSPGPLKETSILSDESAARLWALAATHSIYSKQIDQAHQYYAQAKETGHHTLSIQSQSILRSIWQKINPYLNKKDKKDKKEKKPKPGKKKKKEKTKKPQDKKKKAHVHARLAPLLPYPNFDDNPLMDGRMRELIRPHLMPLNHFLKPTLESIFAQSVRVIRDEESLMQAGFAILFRQHASFVRVVAHPLLNGYLVKLYIDAEQRKKKGIPGWEWLIQRCEGARNIRNLIRDKKIKLFTVPDKWIYPLPYQGVPLPPPENTILHPIVLVVTNMNLTSWEESANAWKTQITTKHLDELFCILSHGYGSTFLIDNVPYTRSGQFACIDTEYPQRKIKYDHVYKYLSDEMQVYWRELINKGGNL